MANTTRLTFVDSATKVVILVADLKNVPRVGESVAINRQTRKVVDVAHGTLYWKEPAESHKVYQGLEEDATIYLGPV